ncbi:MAG: hypothetical protein DDT42_01683 [candidate division WS2 bacterium]|uniref:Uncharacterized protein n=1 Tax=Psychracetigena formicireducens TaxID=2986056 RepID=A0A9E2BJ38_PSYF1|nr:hypothetical protein [Candidatus Psychracetigena formicireducens]
MYSFFTILQKNIGVENNKTVIVCKENKAKIEILVADKDKINLCFRIKCDEVIGINETKCDYIVLKLLKQLADDSNTNSSNTIIKLIFI